MLRSIIVIGLAVTTGNPGNPLVAQTKTSKTTATKKIAKSRPETSVLTWKGKVYKLTSDEPLPLKELNEVFKTAEGTAALKRQLADTIAELRRLKAASINADGLSIELKEAKGTLERGRRQLYELNRELEETKNELEEAEDERQEMKEKLQDIKFSVSDVSFEMDRLKRAIDGFTYLDWKTVVPNVVSRFRSLQNEFSTLKLESSGLP